MTSPRVRPTFGPFALAALTGLALAVAALCLCSVAGAYLDDRHPEAVHAAPGGP